MPANNIHDNVLILPSKYVISKICIRKNVINDIIQAWSKFFPSLFRLFNLFKSRFVFFLQQLIVMNNNVEKIINDEGNP